MARTTDQIARSVLGNQLAEIIALTAEVERLREENARLQQGTPANPRQGA